MATAPVRDEATELLQGLLRANTVNPPGNETLAAELLRAYLEDAGVDCELYAKVPERANLVARIPGTGTGCAPIPRNGPSTRGRASFVTGRSGDVEPST